PRGWAEIVRESLAAPGVGPRNRSSERAFCGCSSPQNPLGRLHLEGDTRWVSEHRRCRGGGRWTGERQVLILVEVFVCSWRRPLASRRRALVASSRCHSRSKVVLPEPTASESASSRREERCGSGGRHGPRYRSD